MTPSPLKGVRILAIEHMLALPYGTQLLGFMGAEVLKVEPPTGDAGRGSRPLLDAPWGGQMGAVFARANLGKRSISIDLKQQRGRELLLKLVPRFDIVAENLRPGALARLGVTFDVLKSAKPDIILATVSGFGHLYDSPYSHWPAYAPVVEATAGLYTMGISAEDSFSIGSLGALADVQAGVFAALGMLAALRERDRTGEAQHVDIAMADAAMVLIDAGPMLASLGLPAALSLGRGLGIQEKFHAADGLFCLTIMREHMFARLATAIGHPEWIEDERFAKREQWLALMETVIRPAVEEWSKDMTRLEAADTLARAGVAVGLVQEAGDLIHDGHVARRSMLKSVPLRGHDDPMLVTGNPVKFLSGEPVTSTVLPDIGEHTTDVLRQELDLGDADIEALFADGVVTSPSLDPEPIPVAAIAGSER